MTWRTSKNFLCLQNLWFIRQWQNLYKYAQHLAILPSMKLVDLLNKWKLSHCVRTELFMLSLRAFVGSPWFLTPGLFCSGWALIAENYNRLKTLNADDAWKQADLGSDELLLLLLKFILSSLEGEVGIPEARMLETVGGHPRQSQT